MVIRFSDSFVGAWSSAKVAWPDCWRCQPPPTSHSLHTFIEYVHNCVSSQIFRRDNLCSMIDVEACDSFVSAFVIYPSAVVRLVRTYGSIEFPHFFSLSPFFFQNAFIVCQHETTASNVRDALFLLSDGFFFAVLCVAACSSSSLLSFILLFTFRLSVKFILIISYYGNSVTQSVNHHQ